MFGSRKKGNKKQYTPPTASSVNPSAATAAVSAYNNLSSAAAAAALRNLPAAPTNVGAVQTKRTMRRSASVSSEGSRRALSPVPSIKRAMGFGGGNKDTREGVVVSPTGAPALRRRGSSSSIRSMSSMSERTFRSPSPHQSRNPALAAAITASPSGSVASSNNQSMNAAGAAAAMAAGRSSGSRSRSVPPPPPVPIIPKHVIESQPKQQPQQKQTQQTEKQARRATTLGLVQQPLRLASQKQKTGRSSWFGSAAVGDRSSIRSSDTAMDVIGNAQQQERPGSRNSLHNFSYPSRQRLGSPPPSPTATRSTPIAPATAAALAVAPPPAGKLPRSASTERVPTTQPRSQQKAAAASARRSASTSRVTGRYYDAELSDQTLVYDANSRRMVPRGELLMREEREYAILEAAERPLQQQRKKKQQRNSANASLAGTHLSQGTMTHSHGSAAPLNRAELERMKEPAPQQQPAAVAAAVKAAPKTPKSTPPERRLPKIETTSLETPAAVAAATTAAAEPAVAERDFEEAAQPLPALSTSASTPSSSVSSLTALAASQAATSPVAIQSISSPEDGSFEGTLLTEDGRPVLVKRPSIVREDPEGEAEEEKLSNSAAVVAAAAGSRTARDDLDGVSAKHIHHDSDNATQQASPAVTKQAQPVLTKPDEKERARSNSPVRTAHFSPVVSVVGSTNLSVRRHSPPPRSISPRKSALKQSSSPRDASPSDSASEANHSLQGDLTLHNRKKANRVSFDDKAVVVSQSPMPPSPPHSPGLSTLPGASEAPPTSNAAHQPPSRSRSWFSNIGRSKKKSDHSSANNFEDDDVVMKPRPALPSFGSVRDKSHPAQQQEERALVRPINDSQPAHQATQSPTPAETHNTSSDHAIGYIIGAGAAAGAAGAAVASAERQSTPPSSSTGNTANTSRYREPLPPVVTSVDGSGYVSDSGASSDGDDEVEEEQEHSPVLRFDEEQDTTVPGNLDDEPIIPSAPATDDNDQIIILPSPSSPGKSPKKTVPAIAISHPSQENLTAVRGTENDETDDELDQEEEAEKEDQLTAIAAPATPAAAVAKSSPVRSLFDVPGMFPADTDSDGTTKSSPTQAAFANANVNSAVPTRQNAFEPIVQDDDNSYSPQMPATVFATHMPTLHEETSLRNEKLDEDDSDSEVFSDAYEDLSDIEGDGFLSLDAVVDSLVVPDMVKSPFASSPLTGSPSRKAETLQLGPSPLAKEAGTAPSDTTSLTSAAAAGGAVIGMTALTSTAIHKQVNGDAKAGPEDEEDWDKIKAFWRSLTVEKRAQLEKEALQDAADEGDLEDESAAADKKPRRKKSVETRLAEKKAIQELTPAQKTQKAVDVAPAATKATKANKAPAAAAAAATPAPAPIESKSQRPAATRIRKSMRDNAPRATAAAPGAGAPASPDFKTSLRPNPPAQKERTASAFPPKAAVGAINRPQALHSRTMSADSTASSIQGKSGGMAGLLPSALRRRGSDSSESSFRRARSNSNGAATSGFGAGAAAGAAGAAGGFRMSMRGDSKSSAAAAAASNNANGNLNHRSSRFSLRSLSPTGSTTLRGSTESSPQFRRSMRDGSGGTGFTPMDIKRMSSPGPMANSTLRKGAADSGGGFFSSLGKKRGSKLLQRSKESGGGKAGRSRFGDSSDDDDDDIFGPTSRAPAGGGMAANRRSVSTGGAYTFRSRFVDSSDEDEEIPDHRTVGRNKNKDHVVPKTLRTGSSMRSASARPASSSTPLSPLLPEELEEEEEEQNTRANTTQNGISAASYSGAGASSSAANFDNNNLGTSTLRRSRSGRGQIAPMSPMYSPTTTGAVGLNTGSNATPTRRSGGIMSVLRRKKNDGPSSPTSFSNGSANKIQRAGLVDSAARRDTQLERSTAELAAVRSNSIGSQNRRVLGGSGSNTPRFVPQNDDSDDDLDDSEDSPVAVRRNNTAPPAHVRTASWPLPDQHTVNITAADLNNEKKKKKFPGLRRMFRLDD